MEWNKNNPSSLASLAVWRKPFITNHWIGAIPWIGQPINEAATQILLLPMIETNILLAAMHLVCVFFPLPNCLLSFMLFGCFGGSKPKMQWMWVIWLLQSIGKWERKCGIVCCCVFTWTNGMMELNANQFITQQSQKTNNYLIFCLIAANQLPAKSKQKRKKQQSQPFLHLFFISLAALPPSFIQNKRKLAKQTSTIIINWSRQMKRT